ncbi:MAG TPA: Spy/CpxP family protein refolding chaperone [Thermoanaerobaculia bacterium]|nr:Spy/CpxP family protein refolding chaperone [Thermoanaerobaculia bacterium]
MKKLITAAAVLALGASLALAAPHGGKFHGKHGRHGVDMSRMAEKLNLSEAQKQQMKELHEGFKAESEPFRSSFKQTKADYRAALEAGDTAQAESLKSTLETQRAEMDERRKAQHERMLQILTPDQRAQLETMKSERKARRGSRR